jgi:hypothetical protein
MRLLDNKKIKQALVDQEFFPFFHIENAFDENLDPAELVENFPVIKSGGSFHTENLIDGSIKNLVDELEGDDFKQILEDKFQVDLSNAEVVTTLRGYSRSKDGQIHTDSKTKILTVLLYLNPNWHSSVGNLRLLKINNSLDNYIKEIPSEFGNLVAFKVTDDCWHGFEPFEGKRLSIQLNYIYPQALQSHRFRHQLSSYLKKLFKR